MEDRNRPRYVISVAAEMLGTKTYTLRYYERVGVVQPRRSQGNIRLYSENDIMLLKKIRTLIDEMGVNMAGVEVILNMLKQIQTLQQKNEELEEIILEIKKGRT